MLTDCEVIFVVRRHYVKMSVCFIYEFQTSLNVIGNKLTQLTCCCVGLCFWEIFGRFSGRLGVHVGTVKFVLALSVCFLCILNKVGSYKCF